MTPEDAPVRVASSLGTVQFARTVVRSGFVALFGIALATGVVASMGGAAPNAQREALRHFEGLTEQGRLRWNFEAVLHKRFPHRRAISVESSRDRATVDFSCGGHCGPKSRYLLWTFVFKNAHGTAFHVSKQKAFAGSFGNYPVQVLVHGHPVACDVRESRFLIQYADSAAFDLGCSRPPA
jgi:hypothetical protein